MDVNCGVILDGECSVEEMGAPDLRSGPRGRLRPAHQVRGPGPGQPRVHPLADRRGDVGDVKAAAGRRHVARAKALADDQSLYERDFCLWLEQQATLLREGRFDELDLANLIEEIEAMARRDKKAIKSNLVVLLTHLLKHQFQPEQRSSSWRGSIVEHRQRLRDDFEESPSLRPHAARGVRVRLRRRPRAGERRDRAGAPRLPQVQPLHPGADPRSEVPARLIARGTFDRVQTAAPGLSDAETCSLNLTTLGVAITVEGPAGDRASHHPPGPMAPAIRRLRPDGRIVCRNLSPRARSGRRGVRAARPRSPAAAPRSRPGAPLGRRHHARCRDGR